MGRKRNFRTIMTSMTAAAIAYAVAGYHVIIDFSIPPWFLDTARRIAKARDVPLDFVVLRPSEKVCAERAASRSEGRIAGYEAYRELYASFDAGERYIIRDDKSNAARTGEADPEWARRRKVPFKVIASMRRRRSA
ncbi:MAG: phosphotransferase-like protein [Candidatus Sulfotelmatobacter sp.]